MVVGRAVPRAGSPSTFDIRRSLFDILFSRWVFVGCQVPLSVGGNGQTPKAEHKVEQATPNVECRTERPEGGG
jgi:hypothetical protein